MARFPDVEPENSQALFHLRYLNVYLYIMNVYYMYEVQGGTQACDGQIQIVSESHRTRETAEDLGDLL